MNRYRKTRKDATSEGTHVARGVIGTIIVITMILAGFYYWFPQATRAAPPATVKLTVHP